MASVINHDGSGVVTFVGTSTDSAGECVCTLGFTTTGTQGDEMAFKAWNAWKTYICPLLSGVYKFNQVRLLVQLDDNLESWESFGTGVIAGGVGGGMLPANVAVLVQKRTAFAGKKNRGRFFLPGVPAGDVSPTTAPNALDASVLPTFQTGLDDFYDSLKSEVDATHMDPVILHPNPATPVTAVTAFSVQARLATQRGRLRN